MSARTVTLHVRLSEDVVEALTARAGAEERPLASLLAIILKASVQKEKGDEPRTRG